MKQHKWCSEHKSKTYIKENANLDSALEFIGYGKFHYGIMASCAFCFLSSATQYSLTAYAMPAALCELHLTSPQIGFINASFIVGAISSSFLWGIIADLSGRKKVLIITMLLDVLVTISCSLMQNFIGITICRFITGFLIGAPGSVTFTYLAEFHAPKHRTKTWGVLPLTINVKYNNFILCSPWRLFVLILIVPELIGGIWLMYLPESPKFLGIVESKKALAVLQHMYAINNGKNKNEFPVKEIIREEANRNSDCGKKTPTKLICEIYAQMYKLFKPPLVSITLLAAFIMFSNMFGYYGLGLWLPVLLNRNSENFIENNVTFHNLKNASDICVTNFNTDLYENTVIMGATAFLSNLFTGWLSGKLEKRIIPIVTLLLGGISSGWMHWINSTAEYVIASCIFQSTMSVANVAIGSVVVELFPTDVNAIAICTTIMAGRLGAIFSNIVFGLLIDANPTIALFLVSGILLLGAILCVFIPSSNKKLLENGDNANKHEVEVSIVAISS